MSLSQFFERIDALGEAAETAQPGHPWAPVRLGRGDRTQKLESRQAERQASAG